MDTIGSVDKTLKTVKSQMVEINYLGLGDQEEALVEAGLDILTKKSSFILSKHVYTT